MTGRCRGLAKHIRLDRATRRTRVLGRSETSSSQQGTITATSRKRGLGDLLAVGAAASMLIGLALTLLAHTPRARLNVMQVVSVIFFSTIIVRSRVGKKNDREDSGSRKRRIWLALSIAACVWGAMIPYYFISDDFAILHSARNADSGNFWGFLANTQAGTFFRPLGFGSLLLEFRMWQFWSGGYHITNLLLHLTGLVGVFLLCRNLGLGPEHASATALVYGILPIQAEGVAWLSSRFDLLATCLTIWAMLMYLRFRENGGKVNYVVALLCFSLAVLSKESGYAFPLLILSAELFVMPNRRFKPWLGFALLGSLAFLGRWLLLGGVGGYAAADGKPAAFSFGYKTLEGLLLRGPTQLLFGFNWVQPTSGYFVALVSMVAGLLLAVAFCIQQTSSMLRLIRFGLAWVFVSMLPPHFLLVIGPGLTNSREPYMASVGIGIVLGALLAGIEHVRFRRASIGFVAVVFGLGVFHNLQAWNWTSEIGRGFLDQVKRLEPAPPENATFVFHDMPDTVRGIFFFHEGLSAAIDLAYGRDDIKAYKASAGSTTAVVNRLAEPHIHLGWNNTTQTVMKFDGPR